MRTRSSYEFLPISKPHPSGFNTWVFRFNKAYSKIRLLVATPSNWVTIISELSLDCVFLHTTAGPGSREKVLGDSYEGSKDTTEASTQRCWHSTTWPLILLWRTENAWIPGEICMMMGYLKAVEILSFWFAPWREMTEWRNGKTDDFLHWKRHDIQDSASVEKALLGLAFYKPHLISFLVKEMGPNVKRLKV